SPPPKTYFLYPTKRNWLSRLSTRYRIPSYLCARSLYVESHHLCHNCQT
ncbi:hypothetical protein D043_3781B, partial [Vibrio parahaemolyticus EKP-021]